MTVSQCSSCVVCPIMFTLKGLVSLKVVATHTSSEMGRADGGVSSDLGAGADHEMDALGVIGVGDGVRSDVGGSTRDCVRSVSVVFKD